MKICYRFGIFPQKNLFYNHRDLYDEIMVNAYMFELYEDATTLFLLDIDKPYVIDPATFIFNMLPSNLKDKQGKPKKHYEKLGQKFGPPVDSIAGKRRINPVDFDSLSDQKIGEFCERFLSYQSTRLASKISKVKKYVDRYRKLRNQGKITKRDSKFLEKFEGIVEELELEDIKKPERLIPPYFLAEYPGDRHYDLSLKLSRKCAEYKKDMKLFPVIFLSKEFLAYGGSIQKVVDDYDWDEFDGYYIWINDFSENFVSVDDLRNLRILVRSLSERTSKPIINFYSAYFSIMLHHFGMTGAVSGICHSSSKNIFEPTGKPPDRYYLNYAYYKAILEDAERIHRFYTDLTCDCPACREGIERARQLLAKSRRLFGAPERIFISSGMNAESRGAHFLYSRKKEADQVEGESLSSSIGRLNSIIGICNEREGYLLDKDLLKRWIEALS